VSVAHVLELSSHSFAGSFFVTYSERKNCLQMLLAHCRLSAYGLPVFSGKWQVYHLQLL
jgi:hypothetical protein